MKKPIAALIPITAVALVLAATASAGLPKPKGDVLIDVPKSIGGVELTMKIKQADRAWGRRGNCDRDGRFKACSYSGRNPEAGSADIEAARRGRVSSFAIAAGRSDNGGYVFDGRLLRFETRDAIGLGDKGAKVRRAYPKAIRTANRTGYIVRGRGRSYMTFQTLDKKHITAITVVDGRNQG